MARMYDPYTARFLSEDTYLGDPNDPLSLNLYSYCHNNLIAYYDPTGHWPNVIKLIKDGTKKVYNTVKDGVEDAYNTVKEMVTDAYSYLKEVFKNVDENYEFFNQNVAKPFITDTLDISKDSFLYKAMKYVGIKTEAILAVPAHVIKGGIQIGEGVTNFISNSQNLNLNSIR